MRKNGRGVLFCLYESFRIGPIFFVVCFPCYTACFCLFCFNYLIDLFGGVGNGVGKACAQVVLLYVEGWGTMSCH